MGEDTARIGLPLLAAGQAGKEVTVNEALALLDLALWASVEALGAEEPPFDPAEGQAWVLGPAPRGVWAGRPGALAGWTAGGWRFVPPFEGLEVWVAPERLRARFAAGAWTTGEVRAARVLVDGLPVLGARRPAIPAPAGGTTADAEARAAIGAVLDALRAHGLIAA